MENVAADIVAVNGAEPVANLHLHDGCETIDLQENAPAIGAEPGGTDLHSIAPHLIWIAEQPVL